MNKFFGIMTKATLVAVIGFGFLMRVQADTLFWYSPLDSTNDWYDVTYWNTNWNPRLGDVLPSPADSVYISGVCSVEGGSNAVVTTLQGYPHYYGGEEMIVNIESGSTLTVSNYCRIGVSYRDGTVNVKGHLNVVNSLNNGFVLGGYNTTTNNVGTLIIDGGKVTCGENTKDQPMVIGGASTGVVEIVNGGLMLLDYSCKVGSSGASAGYGSLTIHDGYITNKNSFTIGDYSATGRMVINDGIFSLADGTGALDVRTGSFEINGGKFIGSHGFNNPDSGANRRMIVVGSSVEGKTGKFIQNGGYVEAVGLNIGPDGKAGSTIISNGVFKAMSNNGSWPCLNVYDKFTLAGGEFQVYTNSGSVWLREGGVLEISGGKFSRDELHGYPTLFSYSNSTIRVIGSKAEIDVGYWRGDSPDGGVGPANTTLELILTQDEGHISTIKSPATSGWYRTALPGTLDVGFNGGACLLATNQLTCIWARTGFKTTFVDPANYGLDLWDAAIYDVATGGDNLDLTLKAGASQGTVSLPGSTYASFAPTSYGYVDVENLNLGSLPELNVIMTMTAGAKTLDAVVQDLQTAGYTNSVVTDSSTIVMKIPAADITADDETFAWDFSEFDGTVNATVSAVAFNFNPQGSIFLIQ